MSTTLDTTESPSTPSVAITENSSDPGSAQAYLFTQPTEEYDNEESSEPEEDDDSVNNSVQNNDTKKHAKRHISSDNDDDHTMSDGEIKNTDDEKPVILETESPEEESSDDEEVLFVGTKKAPSKTTPTAGNSHRNMCMTFCVGNVYLGKAVGHFMFVANGFDAHGSPRTSFRCHCLNIWVNNGKCTISI
jgi:hypothetical protein